MLAIMKSKANQTIVIVDEELPIFIEEDGQTSAETIAISDDEGGNFQMLEPLNGPTPKSRSNTKARRALPFSVPSERRSRAIPDTPASPSPSPSPSYHINPSVPATRSPCNESSPASHHHHRG